MSNVKISDLPAASSFGSTDVFPIVQSGTTKKVTAAVALSSAVLTQSTTVTTIQEMVSANVPIGNAILSASVATGAITLALKTLAGTDPSSTDVITVVLRDTTITDGSLDAYTLSSALSTVISSGSSLGCSASETVRIHVGIMRNGSTSVEIFYWTAYVSSSDVVKSFNPTAFISTTAEGGAGGADTAQTAYSTTARTSQPWVYFGYIEATSSGTAGVWSAITKIVTWQPGVPLPGQIIQIVPTSVGTNASGTTQVTLDDSIPPITEGDQYMTLAVTPNAVMNPLTVVVNAFFTANEADASIVTCLFQDSTTDALCTSYETAGAVGGGATPHLITTLRAGTTSSTTFKVRAGTSSNSTPGTVTYFNSYSGGALFGGTMNSTIVITEQHA